ncbi:60S ribosomal protein L29-like [Echinops telfairi]|uniref:60S ribosomal protein L29-like n=1 Tax=Echinops telfairi TaxID=9371 RepID=A0ABM0ZPM4_ECHTE|nr:60S ribosomal protein L29-like [Echinops telfairi]
MGFSKKHNKKGLKKMQVNNTKAAAVHVESTKGHVKPMEVKAKVPMNINRKLSGLAYIAQPKGLRLCQPKAKAQSKVDAPAKTSTPANAPQSAPPQLTPPKVPTK